MQILLMNLNVWIILDQPSSPLFMAIAATKLCKGFILCKHRDAGHYSKWKWWNIELFTVEHVYYFQNKCPSKAEIVRCSLLPLVHSFNHHLFLISNTDCWCSTCETRLYCSWEFWIQTNKTLCTSNELAFRNRLTEATHLTNSAYTAE